MKSYFHCWFQKELCHIMDVTHSYTGKIVTCEIHVKQISREIHVKFTWKVHMKFTWNSFHVNFTRGDFACVLNIIMFHVDINKSNVNILYIILTKFIVYVGQRFATILFHYHCYNYMYIIMNTVIIRFNAINITENENQIIQDLTEILLEDVRLGFFAWFQWRISWIHQVDETTLSMEFHLASYRIVVNKILVIRSCICYMYLYMCFKYSTG